MLWSGHSALGVEFVSGYCRICYSDPNIDSKTIYQFRNNWCKFVF